MSNPIADIKALRKASNIAIAAHDVAGIGAIMAADLVVTVGEGGTLVGRDAVLAAFAQQFAAFPDLVFTRTPKSIKIGHASGQPKRAFEEGEWSGSWTDGSKVTTGGRYAAQWLLSDTGWHLTAEIFVSLR